MIEPRDFIFWLKGVLAAASIDDVSPTFRSMIKEELESVNTHGYPIKPVPPQSTIR
jgi:hypothetical protein